MDDHTIFTVIYYNFPTSPEFIHFKINLNVFPSNSDVDTIYLYTTHNFRKFNESCRSSLLFAVKKYSHNKTNIFIEMHHTWETNAILAKFGYTFYPGFDSNYYQLVDQYENFGVISVIQEGEDNYIQTPGINTQEFYARLKLLKNNRGELCIVTENKKPIFIRPNYINSIPNGLITDLVVKFIHSESPTISVKYPAFECHTYEFDINKSIFFVIEHHENTKVQFEVNYEYYDDNFKIEHMFFPKFHLGNIQFWNVEEISYINPLSKILFLLPSRKFEQYCPDGTERILYKSYKENTYYAKELKQVQISKLIFMRKWISHSIFNPCSD